VEVFDRIRNGHGVRLGPEAAGIALDTVLTRGAASGEFRPNAPAAGRVLSSSLLLQAIWCNDADRLAPANKSRVVQEMLEIVLEGIAR